MKSFITNSDHGKVGFFFGLFIGLPIGSIVGAWRIPFLSDVISIMGGLIFFLLFGSIFYYGGHKIGLIKNE